MLDSLCFLLGSDLELTWTSESFDALPVDESLGECAAAWSLRRPPSPTPSEGSGPAPSPCPLVSSLKARVRGMLHVIRSACVGGSLALQSPEQQE